MIQLPQTQEVITAPWKDLGRNVVVYVINDQKRLVVSEVGFGVFDIEAISKFDPNSSPTDDASKKRNELVSKMIENLGLQSGELDGGKFSAEGAERQVADNFRKAILEGRNVDFGAADGRTDGTSNSQGGAGAEFDTTGHAAKGENTAGNWDKKFGGVKGDGKLSGAEKEILKVAPTINRNAFVRDEIERKAPTGEGEDVLEKNTAHIAKIQTFSNSGAEGASKPYTGHLPTSGGTPPQPNLAGRIANIFSAYKTSTSNGEGAGVSNKDAVPPIITKEDNDPKPKGQSDFPQQGQ